MDVAEQTRPFPHVFLAAIRTLPDPVVQLEVSKLVDAGKQILRQETLRGRTLPWKEYSRAQPSQHGLQERNGLCPRGPVNPRCCGALLEAMEFVGIERLFKWSC